jgi:hypothetical protein
MSQDNSVKNMPCNKPDFPPLSQEERNKTLEAVLRRMVMIGDKVYGLEDDAAPDAEIDCASRTSWCKAFCCTYVFALTQEEVKKGFFKYNIEKPFYMARDADGYCPYLDRASFQCSIHDRRPLRCRKYVCKDTLSPVLSKNS